MDYRVFSERVLDAAKRRGVAAETYARVADRFSVNACDGEIDRYDVDSMCGLSLRVKVDGRDGYAYTERFEDEEALLERAMDNARAIEETDEHPMQTPQVYASVTLQPGPMDRMTADQKIALALELEEKARALDPRVKRVIDCTVSTGTSETMICNSLGLHAVRHGRSGACYVCPSVEENGEIQTGDALRIGPDALDLNGCAREAVENAVGRLGGMPVPSGSYRAIFQNRAMADLLAAFAPMFSAAEAQKGCSLLAGREGERIAAPCVSILDDPFHPIAPRAFDDEGTPCMKKRVVDGGVLTTLLHNLKTAAKAGVASTGNGARATVASTVDVAPSVFYIEPGDTDADALLAKLGDGLLITELNGLHAGLSCVSGDFSLKAFGKRVVDGRITQSVSDITVAGNFLTLLGSVEAAGDTLSLEITGASGFFATAPDILVAELSVAGK